MAENGGVPAYAGGCPDFGIAQRFSQVAQPAWMRNDVRVDQGNNLTSFIQLGNGLQKGAHLQAARGQRLLQGIDMHMDAGARAARARAITSQALSAQLSTIM